MCRNVDLHLRAVKSMLARASVMVACCLSAIGAETRILELWPEGVPGLKTNAGDEIIIEGRITNVHRPNLTVYSPPAGIANGTAILYCPGGGYVRIAAGRNGGPITETLNRLGVTVFVLKYRMVEYGHPAPLQDVLRAVQLVRSRAGDFGLATNRIGVLGASAGGHLAGCAATMWDEAGTNTLAVSARPDFAALIYPVVTMQDPFVHKGSRKALLGDLPNAELIDRLSIEQRVRRDSPPFFIAATMADRSVPVENSLRLYEALRNAGVPAEMHLYAQGSHGNSLDPQFGPTAEWPKRCEEWMRFNGWLPAPNSSSTSSESH
jgi:acetyl esterase/lipase